MAQDQAPPDATPYQFDWPRLGIILTAVIVASAILICVAAALTTCMRRRRQTPTMPRAFLLPVYVQHGSSHTSASAAPARSTLMYPRYPPMPSPVYEEEDPLARRQTRVSVPPQARTSHRRTLGVVEDEDIYILGSVSHQQSRRRHRIHPALSREHIRESSRESVETLPRYENPPSYKLDNGFRQSI